MKLILIAGKARSGKSECSKILKELLLEKKLKVVITEYSKYIKLFAKELIGWDGITEPKPRKFLQEFGSYIRHQSNQQNYFINRMKEDIRIYENFIDVLIISDVRLKEEIEELGYLQPITIYIQNDKALYDLSDEEKKHETEHALDHYQKFDYRIVNKSEEEIRYFLECLVNKIL